MTLEEKILNIIKEDPEIDENGCIQIYTDYYDRKLSSETINTIFNATHPRDMFYEILDNWALDHTIEYGSNDLEKYIRTHLTEEENQEFTKQFDNIWDKVTDIVQYIYNPEDFNQELNVNMMIDVGNWKYDCTCDNVLNCYGTGDEIPKESSILYLTKSQGKEQELKDFYKKILLATKKDLERPVSPDTFIESCIEEYENLSSSMGTLTMLVKMPLLTVLDLLEAKEKERTGMNDNIKTSIVFSPGTICGLFDPWSGSGSLLGIKFDKDFEVDIQHLRIGIEKCEIYGYDVDEVYGLIDTTWKKAWNIQTVNMPSKSFS